MIIMKDIICEGNFIFCVVVEEVFVFIIEED